MTERDEVLTVTLAEAVRAFGRPGTCEGCGGPGPVLSVMSRTRRGGIVVPARFQDGDPPEDLPISVFCERCCEKATV